jgi:hypothetical protein
MILNWFEGGIEKLQMLLCVYVTEQGQARCSQDQFCGGS